MKKEIIIIIIILLILYFSKKDTFTDSTSMGYLVTVYKQGNDVNFAVKVNNEWRFINASKQETLKIGDVELKTSIETSGSFKLEIFKNGKLEQLHYADKEANFIY